MEYLNIAEVAEKWGISPRRLQTMCAAGKIKGATRFGKAWMIPKTTQKPVDGRTKAGKENNAISLELDMQLPRKTPFLHMTDLYSSAGTAEKSIAALAHNPEAQTLFAAEIAYSRGGKLIKFTTVPIICCISIQVFTLSSQPACF